MRSKHRFLYLTANVFLRLQTAYVYSGSGVFQCIDLIPAAVHDIHFLKDIKEQLSDCILLGERLSLIQVQVDLFNYANITLETPKRINKNYLKRNINNLKLNIF